MRYAFDKLTNHCVQFIFTHQHGQHNGWQHRYRSGKLIKRKFNILGGEINARTNEKAQKKP
ncbi:hypothetical protein [Enterovibrio sp. 27052020O]|uniref:hypothetical protein n=1 Tax=Enterovibrio sp. 27052020O TaxID=3241166 RepID=UPI00388D51D1